MPRPSAISEFGLHKAARSLEQALSALRGVRRVRVETDDFGITAVKALVVPERDRDETIRDVQQAASDELGIKLEPARVHVLSSQTLKAGRHAGRRRLASLATTRSDGHFTARVILELEGDTLAGETRVPAGLEAQYQCVARAVVKAIDDLLERPLEVETVEILQVGNGKLALVSVVDEGESLLGSALITSDEYEAIARATLDAVNRVLFETDARVGIGAT